MNEWMKADSSQNLYSMCWNRCHVLEHTPVAINKHINSSFYMNHNQQWNQPLERANSLDRRQLPSTLPPSVSREDRTYSYLHFPTSLRKWRWWQASSPPVPPHLVPQDTHQGSYRLNQMECPRRKENYYAMSYSILWPKRLLMSTSP